MKQNRTANNKKKPQKKQSRPREYHRPLLGRAYNMVLYEARQQAGMRRFRFARTLGISPFLYHFIESGYCKAGKRQQAKISAYLGEDYEPYTRGVSSYPQSLPEKPVSRVGRAFYNMLGSTVFRLLFVLLVIACLGAVSYGLEGSDKVTLKGADYYPDQLHELRNGILEKGNTTASLSLDLIRKEIYHKEADKLVSIKATPEEGAYSQIDFTVHRWSAEGRLSYHCEITSPHFLDISYTDYATKQHYSALAMGMEGQYLILGVLSSSNLVESEEEQEALYNQWEPVLSAHLDEFEDDIRNCIQEKLGLEVDIFPLFEAVYEASRSHSQDGTRYGIALFGGALLGMVFLFCLIYSLIYGTKHGVARQFVTSNNMVPYARRCQPPTDLRLTPFLPETFLSILGSLLLLFSSARFILLASSVTIADTIELDTAMVFNREMTELFYVSMFLLYFLDFDSFLDDKKIIGKIYMYLLMYLALYIVETSAILSFSSKPGMVFDLITRMRLPNMFGSISCYYLIMYCLFFTPKYARTKARLRLHRLCSLLPVLIIFGSKLVFNGGEKYFGWNMSIRFKYLFNGERITFSLLCIAYLFGLYFLRLFFEKRYGMENALKYFNGNRFIWLKNIMTCLLIILINLVSLLSRKSPVATAFGLGEANELYLLVPLVLFYHPHKGPRNRWVDALTMTVYMVSLSLGYIVGGFILLLGLLGV